MANTTRAKLSIKNKYYIDKHRYYELKHFCLQYNLWKREYLETDGLCSRATKDSDPTPRLVVDRLTYFERMKLVEQAALTTDPDLYHYILMAVTKGYSFNTLKTKHEIPCGKDLYYSRYRKFFWVLDRIRY